MSDTIAKAQAAAEKIAELQKERSELLASALAHEDQARKDRTRATACKNEIAEWTTALNSHRVAIAVESDQQAAAKAKGEAEKAKRAADADREAANADREKAAAVLAEVEKMKADLAAGAKTEKPVEMPTA